MKMAANRGILYEQKINKILRREKAQGPNFEPAGSNSNAPDAEIRVKGNDYKVEIKLDTAVDYGQGSLDYNLIKKKWIIAGAKTESAIQMAEFLSSIGVEKIVNKEWGRKGPPRKFTVDPKKFTKKDVDFDYANFKDFFVHIPSDSVSKYYNSKNTYYMQIGGKKGLYYMGSDPAGLGVPEFKLKLKLRVRLKRGGSIPIYNYRFSTAIQSIAGTLSTSNKDLEDVKFVKQIAGMV